MIIQYETEIVIAQIIATQLGLDFLHPQLVTPSSSNFITIYNQEFTIPNTKGLFVTVEFLNDTPISNNNQLVTSDSGIVQEIQYSTVRETLMIDIFSRNNTSRQRKNEIVGALNSLFCKQIQDKYAFKIFPITSNFINASRAEGATMLNRYSITLYVQRFYTKTIDYNETSDTYYDKFEVQLYDEGKLYENIGEVNDISNLFSINPIRDKNEFFDDLKFGDS